MSSRAKKLGIFLLALAISVAIFQWIRLTKTNAAASFEENIQALKAGSPLTTEGEIAPTVEETTPRRDAASVPTPQEQYRKALEKEDEMKRLPTWEEMRSDRPAEF